MKYYKSIISLKKIELIQFYKILYKYKGNTKKLFLLTKKELIHKINNKLLNNLTCKELYNICVYNNINIYKSIKKKKILNKLLYFITQKSKYNLINQYYYDNKNNNTKIIKYQNKKKRFNNESFGISCEYVLCKIYNLKNNLHSRINYNYINNLTTILNQFKYEFKKDYKLECKKYIGFKNNHIDFLCSDNINKNISLSVKSNINNNNLCCPQNIGQCTFNSYISKIKKNHYFKFNKISLNSKFQIKKFIINNINKLFIIYYHNLFSCNYLLWIKENNNNINYDIIKKPNIIKLKPELFTFTKNLKTWKESNTLKYNDITLGLFQIHNNRNCIKFRFNLSNLLKLIKK